MKLQNYTSNREVTIEADALAVRNSWKGEVVLDRDLAYLAGEMLGGGWVISEKAAESLFV